MFLGSWTARNSNLQVDNRIEGLISPSKPTPLRASPDVVRLCQAKIQDLDLAIRRLLQVGRL
jgi:hypothetical protein